MTDKGKKCPNCGAEGKYQGEHEAAARNYQIAGQTVVDVGWRCWKCGHEWGFEISELRVSALEVGFMMAALAKDRAKIPRLWEQLIALMKKFREECGVTVEDIGDGLVKLTDKDGNTIIREKNPWE